MKVLLSVSLIASVLMLVPVRALGASKIVVAVIDTGVDVAAVSHLCQTGHMDFVTHSSSPVDYHGHGTHIASLIEKNAGEGDFCIVSLRYYSESATGNVNLANMIKAINYAIDLHVNYINISGGGAEYSEEEFQAIKKALNRGIKIVAAAGNDHRDISIKDNRYYPACYDKRITVVGNLAEDGSRSPSSNYGEPTNRWEIGTGVRANVPCYNAYDKPPCSGKLTGTSQATAIATGKLINKALHLR